MNLLDMRTVLLTYGISSSISATVMISLWMQNRKRSPELVFWLVDFLLQFAGMILIVLRGILPDFFTMVLSNTLIMAGTVLLLIGLERYTGKPGPQWFNYIFLGAFFLVQCYFVYFQDSLQARTINNSVGILVTCGQCAWLLLKRVEAELRPETRAVGVVFLLFSVVSLTRIFVDLVVPPVHDLYQSGLYDTLGVLVYGMLYVSLTFGLVLMVNRRLFIALENDISFRKQAEAALKVSEEKFSVSFHNSPDAILVSSLPEGKIIDANESFFLMTEFGKEECLGKTTIDLNLWDSLEQREEFVEALQKQKRILNFEADFRKKSGVRFYGAISGEQIQLQGQVSALSFISDITERKQAEQEQKFISTHDALTGLYNRGYFIVEMERQERGRRFPVSIVMADLNELKETNDRHGHAAGDALLQAAAQVLAAAFRGEDVIARIGGDEFAILLPETGTAAAQAALQRVRKMIEERNSAAGAMHLSLSIGVSTAREPGSLSEVLKEADANMYRDKRGEAAV